MADAAGIKEGQQLFEANCAACHLKDGGGNVGPNLTDDYWLHKGSLNDIFHTIKVGYPDKGMQKSWSGSSPKADQLPGQFYQVDPWYKAGYAKAQRGEFWVKKTLPVLFQIQLQPARFGGCGKTRTLLASRNKQ